MPKISIIIPIYNTSKYLHEALESVINQTLKDIEIICINDGSTDNSLDIIKEYAEKDKRIIIINKDNKGYGHSMNVGIKIATGEYLGILESDDYLSLAMYENLYNIAVKYNLDSVRGDFYRFVRDKNYNMELKYCPIDSKYIWYNRIFNPSIDVDSCIISNNIWSGIYRMNFIKENNIYFNETPGASFQDNGFFWQVQIFAKRVMFINKPFYYCRRDNPNSSVKDSTKVWEMSKEYNFIYNLLTKNDEIWKKYRIYFWYWKCKNNNFIENLISYESKNEFIIYISNEYKIAQKTYDLVPDLFSYDEWSKILWITNDPENYLIKNYHNIEENEINNKVNIFKDIICKIRRKIIKLILGREIINNIIDIKIINENVRNIINCNNDNFQYLNKKLTFIENCFNNKVNIIKNNINNINKNYEKINDNNEKLNIIENNINKNVENIGKRTKILVNDNLFKTSIENCEWLKDKSFNFGGWAMDSAALYSLYRILNDIKPVNILEFGLGQSSRMLYQYKKYYSNISAITIEHDKDWINYFKNIFDKNNEMNIEQFDIKVNNYNGYETKCYDGLEEAIKNKKYDLIIVDGPFGSEHYSRSQIIDISKNNLDEQFIIFMDDSNREGEKETIIEICDVLKNKNIEYLIKEYSGEKNHTIICSENYKYLITLKVNI